MKTIHSGKQSHHLANLSCYIPTSGESYVAGAGGVKISPNTYNLARGQHVDLWPLGDI